jgi:TonB family protein
MPRPRLASLACLVAALVALVEGRAWAQAAVPAPAPAPPASAAPSSSPAPTTTGGAASTVVPPSVKKNEGAAYPKRALDEGFREPAEVGLTLTVDATGHVTSAVVEQPAGHGFDEAAVEAAKALEFEPATRDGKPVAAKIRFRYQFAPPPGALGGRVVAASTEQPIAGATVVVRDAQGHEQTATTAADGSWRIGQAPAGTYHVTVRAAGMEAHEADQAVLAGEEVRAVDRLSPPKPAPGTADAGAEAIEEVEVRGTKPPREVSKFTIDQREIARIPGTNGDALRSLQNLPGVARSPGLAGFLIVRGSAPEDTQYFVDGTPVPIVYHFGGLSSVVPTEMLDRIDFFPGNFSAQYGRAMGGIVDVGLAEPKSDKLHVMAQADLIDTRAIVQGPLFDTGWNFALGGRRSWFDVWLGPVLQAANANVSVAPVYYDYQAILERKIGAHQDLRFAVFGSDDRVDILLQSPSQSAPTLAGEVGSHTGFWRIQGLYKNKLSSTSELRVVAAVGEDYLEFNAGNIFFHLNDYPITSRVELAQKLDAHLTLNLGLDEYYSPYSGAAQLPLPPKAGLPPAGPFAAQPPVATTASGSVFEPAVYAELEATPWQGGRIVPGIRLDYTDATNAWDFAPRVVVRQDVTTEPRTTLKGGIGLFAQPPQAQETNAVFGMSGLTSNRSLHYDLGVERVFTRYVEATLDGFYKQLDNLVEPGLGNTGSGVVYGAETLLRYKPDERFFGWIAYTLSRSLRRDQPGAPLRLFQYDETHVLTVLGSYRIGRGWELGMRYRLSSGYMYTPNQYGFYDENVGSYLPLSAYPQDGSRLPLFHSLDIRVDKTWKTGWGKIGAYLDVLNVYNSGNVDGVAYDFNYTHTSVANDLPIIPSIGMRVEN